MAVLMLQGNIRAQLGKCIAVPFVVKASSLCFLKCCYYWISSKLDSSFLL